MSEKYTLKQEEIRAGYSEEDAYFRRQEQERKAGIADLLPRMSCPKCGDALGEVDLVGVKADRCPCCAGFYFERSALEALLGNGDLPSIVARLRALLAA